MYKYQRTLQIEPVPELNGNKRSYLFTIFRRFGPGRSVISVDWAESGSVTAFTHNPLVTPNKTCRCNQVGKDKQKIIFFQISQKNFPCIFKCLPKLIYTNSKL